MSWCNINAARKLTEKGKYRSKWSLRIFEAKDSISLCDQIRLPPCLQTLDSNSLFLQNLEKPPLTSLNALSDFNIHNCIK